VKADSPATSRSSSRQSRGVDPFDANGLRKTNLTLADNRRGQIPSGGHTGGKT
jgi:hypothetical protein